MENLIVKKDFINTSPDLLTNIMQNINIAVNENTDLKMAMKFGCPIETRLIKEGESYKFVVKTKNKIYLLKNLNGEVINIIQEKVC